VTESVCCERWEGPRVEVPDSWVVHVCNEPEGHLGPCRCMCGAERK